jgi:hypothetical protein
MKGAGSRVRPVMEGSEEQDSKEGNGERGAPGALAPGERSAREEAALDRALGKEVGNGRFAIYTSGRSG